MPSPLIPPIFPIPRGQRELHSNSGPQPGHALTYTSVVLYILALKLDSEYGPGIRQGIDCFRHENADIQIL